MARFHRANEQRTKRGEPRLSIGTVHAYVLSPQGQALDSRHVAHAGPTSMIEMLEGCVKKLRVPAGTVVVQPSDQSPRPACSDDALVLHLTSRYLVTREHPRARRDVKGALVPRAADGLGGERSGQWDALPSEDWIVLEREQWTRLLPGKPVAVGGEWSIETELADTLLERFYPTTEQNDLSKNRIDSRKLKLTALSVEPRRVRARIDGRLEMKHPFYPGRDDDNFVKAVLVGVLEFDPLTPRVHALRLVTDGATYGGGKRRQHFGVAVRDVPARTVPVNGKNGPVRHRPKRP